MDGLFGTATRALGGASASQARPRCTKYTSLFAKRQQQQIKVKAKQTQITGE